MDKFLKFVMNPQFFVGAAIGAAVAAVGQIFLLGDPLEGFPVLAFLLFWGLTALGAFVGGSIVRVLKK
jgi:hypothetical protein